MACGQRRESSRWVGSRLPYLIGDKCPKKPEVKAAIAYWNRTTHVHLVERFDDKNLGEQDYVEFVRGKLCSSAVGRQGGKQLIAVDPLCDLDNVIHEIGHAVGLFHEHQRPDREAYVTFLSANIGSPVPGEPDPARNFDRISPLRVVVSSQYGYRSRMHYPRDAYAEPSKDTLQPMKRGQVLDASSGLTPIDISFINKVMYPFQGLPRPSRADLQNGIFEVLALESPVKKYGKDVKEGDSLEKDLNITKLHRRRLWRPFQSIADRTRPKAKITGKQAEGLKKARDAVDLVLANS